jgi:hypothetical protein
MSHQKGALDVNDDEKSALKPPTRQKYKYNAINRKGKFLENY